MTTSIHAGLPRAGPSSLVMFRHSVAGEDG